MSAFRDPRKLIAAALDGVPADVSIIATDWTGITRPLIVCRAVSGRPGQFDRVDDMRLEVIHPLSDEAPSIDAARVLTETVIEKLKAPTVHETNAGFIDRVEVTDVTEPAPSPLFPGPYAVATIAARLWHRPQ